MAKTETKEVAKNEQEAPKPVNTKKGVMSLEDMANSLEDMVAGDPLSADYHKFEPGEEQKCIFIEMTQIGKKNAENGEMVDAVRLLFPDGTYKTNADRVVASVCKQTLVKRGRPVAILISCKGWVDGNMGKYRDFDISELVGK